MYFNVDMSANIKIAQRLIETIIVFEFYWIMKEGIKMIMINKRKINKISTDSS